jgi:CBS domain-containing protein
MMEPSRATVSYPHLLTQPIYVPPYFLLADFRRQDYHLADSPKTMEGDMEKQAVSQQGLASAMDRGIERLRQQLDRLPPFLISGRSQTERLRDEFDGETERLISELLGETSELLEAYAYAQVGEAGGLVNFPDEAPEGGAGARDVERERLNQRKRVLESCIAELEARRAAIATRGMLTPEALIGPQVADFMSTEVRSVHSNASLKEASRLMQDWKVGSLVVTNDRNYVGVITDTDLAREVVARGIDPTTPVKQCMRTPPVTIESTQPIIDAVRLMKDKGTRHLSVIEDGAIIGVISVSNILRYYSGVV